MIMVGVVAFDVFAKVLDPGVDATPGCRSRRAHSNRPIGLNDTLADELSIGPTDAVEIFKNSKSATDRRPFAGADASNTFRSMLRIVAHFDQ